MEISGKVPRVKIIDPIIPKMVPPTLPKLQKETIRIPEGEAHKESPKGSQNKLTLKRRENMLGILQEFYHERKNRFDNLAAHYDSHDLDSLTSELKATISRSKLLNRQGFEIVSDLRIHLGRISNFAANN